MTTNPPAHADTVHYGDRDEGLLAPYRSLPPFISVQEAATLIGLSRSSAYRAVERGELPVVRLGGRLHVPVARLLTLMGLIDPTPATELPWLTDLHTTSR